ncbi:MAG: NADH-quinone oxidoreductase subunit M [Candidatus Omnitrophota bacterium]
MQLIPLLIILPLGAAFFISLAGKNRDKLCDIFSIVITFSLFALSLFFVFNAKNSATPLIYKVGGWGLPGGIILVLDGLSVFMLAVINFIAFIINIFSIDYMKKFTDKYKFYTLFMLMLGGMNGVVITGDIFNLFVFYEVASIASYALVAFGTEKEELEASMKYTVMGVVGSLFILLGIAFLYAYTSTLNMAEIASLLAQNGINSAAIFVSVLFLVGFGIKSAIVPFHAWLPDAHPAAPAPISAMLSGIFIKSLGVYTLCRIFYNVFGASSTLTHLFMFLGALSIIVGGVLALGQSDIKRLLGYSSISQVGYMILGFGIGSPLAIAGALLHLVNHSVFKSLLFLNAGSLEYATGTRNLEQLGGLRTKMPVTSATSLAASMSISGIPPFAGFFSKLLIIAACIKSGYIGYGIIAIIGAIFTISYILKFQKYTFFGQLKEMNKNIREVPILMRIPMIILALICVFGALLILPKAADTFLRPAEESLSKGTTYADLASQVSYEK